MSILNNIKNFFINIGRSKVVPKVPLIIPRAEHNLSRKNISRHVLKVLYTLKQEGYESYLVGGGVRDLLLDKSPKDFDIATNAYPEKIKKLFRHSYIIGRRFQLVHVYFDKQVVEVATFRAHHNSKNSKEGMILRDNVYGSIEQDVLRRDFTINALYYNINDYSVVDYVGGLKDLIAKQICLIGDPKVRYREDPVRMLRAIRFAAKLDFKIHADTEQPLYQLGYLLLNISSVRLYDEYVKLFFTGHPLQSYKLLKHYGLLYILFPSLNLLNNPKYAEAIILKGLNDISKNSNNYKELAPAYLIAILLWYNLLELAKEELSKEEHSTEFIIYKKIAEELLIKQNKIISLSKKIVMCIKDIWLLQLKLASLVGKPGKRADKLINSVKFDRAFRFLFLRVSSADPKAKKIFRWWCKYLAIKGKSHIIPN